MLSRLFVLGFRLMGAKYLPSARARFCILLLTFSLFVAFSVSGCAKLESGSIFHQGNDYAPFYSGNSFASPTPVCRRCLADTSTAAEGYIGVRVGRDLAVTAQLIKGEAIYSYSLPDSGEAAYLPLQSGSGTYQLRLLKRLSQERYTVMDSLYFPVQLNNENAPFLHPNLLVNYNENSLCVREAARLSAASSSETEFVEAVLDYVCDNIRYDDAYAYEISPDYIPDPDQTLRSGKGICFDYAVLTAALLRSQGIPTKVITGYVGADARYHAWNAVYLQKGGWLSLEYKLVPGFWNRIDTTFASCGKRELIYIERYVY